MPETSQKVEAELLDRARKVAELVIEAESVARASGQHVDGVLEMASNQAQELLDLLDLHGAARD